MHVDQAIVTCSLMTALKASPLYHSSLRFKVLKRDLPLLSVLSCCMKQAQARATSTSPGASAQRLQAKYCSECWYVPRHNLALHDNILVWGAHAISVSHCDTAAWGHEVQYVLHNACIDANRHCLGSTIVANTKHKVSTR